MKTPAWFYRFNLFALVLLPVGFLLRLFKFPRFGGRASKLKVVSIENITAFDAAKAEIIREIAKYMNAAVLLGGPGRVGRGRAVRDWDAADDVGSDAKIIAKTGAEVWIGNKAESLRSLEIKDHSVFAAIVSGIGGGIRPIARILVFDGENGIGNGLPWPAGPVFSGLGAAIKRADAVLISGTPGSAAARILRVAKRKKRPVFFARKELATGGLFGKYVVFSGEKNPGQFFAKLCEILSVRVVDKIAFPLGHSYKKNDIIRLFRASKQYEARLITTEKDHARLPSNIRTKVRFIPIEVGLQPNFYLWLERRIGGCQAAAGERKDQIC